MGNTVAAQLVGHEPHGFLSLTLQQSAEESPRCTPVPTGLYEDVDQVTVLIHRAPEILALTVDRHEESSGPGEWHPQALTGVEGRRGTGRFGESLCPTPFGRTSVPQSEPRPVDPAPARRTGHGDCHHPAPPVDSDEKGYGTQPPDTLRHETR